MSDKLIFERPKDFILELEFPKMFNIKIHFVKEHFKNCTNQNKKF